MFTALALGAALAGSATRGPADEAAALAEAVRSLAGHQLHQTYTNLDNLTVSRFFGLREAGELSQMLRAAVESAEEAERQLARVEKLRAMSKEDTAAIAQLRKTAKLLAEQGHSLRAYWETGVADHWKDSEAALKAAWKELVDVLDLEGKKGVLPKPREAAKKMP